MKKIERSIEHGLFASRWLMAPFYIGLVGALFLLLASFMIELWHYMSMLPAITSKDAIVAALSLIDLSLAGNLLLIVIFSGYENFVSKFQLDHHEDNPEWKGDMDFSALKLKLVSSIVAISGVQLLELFMRVESVSSHTLMWMVIIHLVFVVSGVLLALMDWIAVKTKAVKGK
jgi:uncharacterized protein (TIGR00645 family)